MLKERVNTQTVEQDQYLEEIWGSSNIFFPIVASIEYLKYLSTLVENV